MKRLLVLLDIIMSAVSVHAQETTTDYRPLLEEGKQWHYKVCNISSSPEDYEEWYQDYELEGDTIIGANKCLKLYATSDYHARSYRHHYMGALFENDCKVYFISRGRIVPEILYDFSSLQGSQITINGIDVQIVRQKVVSYKSSSWTITYWKPKECEPYQDSWIEGIGSLADLIDYVEMWLPGSYHSELLSCTVNDRLILDVSEFKKSLQEEDSYRPFVEEGKQWTVGYWRYFDTEAFRTEVYSIMGDTLIGTRSCSKLFADGQYIAALYEDDRKVWMISLEETNPKLLYDFGAQVGDELLLNGSTSAKITDVRTIDYHGRQMRCISFEDKSNEWENTHEYISQSVWIEGVGSCLSPLTNCMMNNLVGLSVSVVSCRTPDGIIYESSDNPCARLADMRTQDDYRAIVEEGKVWTVGVWGEGNFDRQKDFCLAGDTLVGGKNYKKLICTTYERGHQGAETRLCALLREENRQVWGIVPESTSKEQLLYDFNCLSGDTITVASLDDTYSHLATLRTTIQYVGNTENGLKKFLLYDPGLQDSYQEWLVGIGALGNPLQNFRTRDDVPQEILVSCRVGESLLYYDDFEASRLVRDIHRGDGISSIEFLESTPSLYDLSGRRLSTRPTKGLYIEDGKVKGN